MAYLKVGMLGSLAYRLVFLNMPKVLFLLLISMVLKTSYKLLVSRRNVMMND